MIQLAREEAGNLSRFLPQLVSRVLDGSFRQILNLRLRLLFVPFRRFQEFFDHLVLQIAGFSLQFRQVAPGDGLQRFLQDLLDAAQILPEARQRFRERFVRRIANAVLLQRQRRVQQRPPPCQPMNRFFGAREVRLYHLHDLPVKLRYCLAARFFKCRSNSRVDLFKDSFGPTLHFFAVRVQHIFQLRLQSGQRLLLRVLELGRMLFEPLAGLPGTRQCRLQPLRLLLQRIPQRCYSLLCLCYSTRRRFAGCRGVTRHLVLQLSHQPARVLVQSARRAILRFRERIFDRRPPPRLHRFQFTCKLPVRERLRGGERGCYLLLNLIGRSPQRLELCSCRFFPLLRGFLVRPRGGFRTRNNLRFRLLGLCLQPG